MTRPVTIADIARRARVSKGAVSYALNGQPGVSAPTRRRILELAAEMGWQPNGAARALSGARTGTLGLVLPRLDATPYPADLVAGIERALTARSATLLVQVAPDDSAEIAIYHRWRADRRVDGVFLADPHLDDPRIPVLETLGLPAVVLGDPGDHGRLPGVPTGDAEATTLLLEHLATLGHRRIARVAGPPGPLHAELRHRAFKATVARLGLAWPASSPTDGTVEQSAMATRELLGASPRPTAVVYDRDVLAVAGISAARELGVDVPGEVSVAALDDSALCRGTHPALTAVDRDLPTSGAHAAQLLLGLVDGRTARDLQTPTPHLVVRDSSARPRG